MAPVPEKNFPYLVFGIIFIFLIIFVAIIWTNGSTKALTAEPVCLTCSVVTQSLPILASYSGTKRALLFGCNYKFSGSPCNLLGCTLNGCIDDVNNISAVLLQHGYSVTKYVDNGSTEMPTKAKIISSLELLISQTEVGDVAFVWYSGHGAQMPNASSDDGFDECWCPPDTIFSGNFLTDRILNSIVKKAPAGSTLFLGSDSCHSGTVFDLRYHISEPGVIKNLDGKMHHKELRKLFSTRGQKFTAVSVPKSITPMDIIQDDFYEGTEATIISLSGCQDFDTSADTFENGQAQGAMTWAFLHSLKTSQTFVDLLRGMRVQLAANGYWQVPQIHLGSLFEINTLSIQSLLQFN